MTITTAPLEGEVLCGARAEQCLCILPAGHPVDEQPHECEPLCGGKWRGQIDTDDFEVVAFPHTSATPAFIRALEDS